MLPSVIVTLAALGAQLVSASTLHLRHFHHHQHRERMPLEEMPESTEVLREQPRDPLKQDREQIRKTAQEAFDGVGDALKLQRFLTNAKVKVAAQDEKIQRLREQEASLHEAHEKASHGLTQFTIPHLATAQRRLERKRAATAEDKREIKKFDKLRADLQARTTRTFEEKKFLANLYHEARETAEQAVKAEEFAKSKFEATKNRARREVQEYKLAEAKFASAKGKAAHDLEQQEAIEMSLKNARGAADTEQMHFEEALTRGENKLEQKINEAETEKEKAEQDFFSAKEKLLAWQAQQREKAQEVEALRREYTHKEETLR